jgi:hypothetical protein
MFNSYSGDGIIHERYHLVKLVFNRMCGKPVKNLSKDHQNILNLLGSVRFAIPWSNPKTLIVSTTIEKMEYVDVGGCQETG